MCEPGDAKITYETGAFLLVNVGRKPKLSEKLLTTIAWSINGDVNYALDGGVYTADLMIKWLKQVGIDAARTPRGSANPRRHCQPLVIPEFLGLVAPY
jgi:glycerol kinase